MIQFPELGSSEESNFKLIHLTRNDTLSRNSNLNYCLLKITAPKGYCIKVSGLLGQLVFVQMYSENSRIHLEFNSTITENVGFPEKFFGNELLIVVENNENLAHISNRTLIKTSLTLNAFKHVSIEPQGFNVVNCIDAKDVIESSGDIKAYNPETLCDEGLTACPNGTCIPINLFCNHNDDCGDNSDETDNMCKSYSKIEPKSEPNSQKTYSSIVRPLNSGKFI